MLTDPYAPDEASLLARIGSGVSSGLSTVGNLFDLPGSMVRDVLGGQNPLDQLLHPFSHNERKLSITGRQLLEKAGLRKNKETGITGWFTDPGEGLRDLAGFGAEIGLDPLTYLTLGSKAVGKGAEVLRAAGAPKMNALERMTKTVADVEKTLPQDVLLDAIKARGFKNKAAFLEKHGSEPMGGLFKLRVPLTDIGTPVGKVAKTTRDVRGNMLDVFDAPPIPLEAAKQTVAGKIAENSDALGKTLRYGNVPGTNFSPGQHIARLFSAPAGGLQTAEVGKFIGGKTYATADDIRTNLRAATARAATAFDKAGLLNDEGSALLTQFMEGVLDPSHPKAAIVAKIASPFRSALDDTLKRGIANGTPLSHIADPTLLKYVPREAVDMLHRYTSGVPRQEYTQAIWGGTEKLRRIIADPELLQGNLPNAVEKFYEKYGKDVMIRQGDQHEIQTLVHHIREGYTPEQRAIGLFGRNRLQDIQDGLISAQTSIAKTDNMIEALAKFAKPLGHIKGEKDVRVWDVLNDAGIEPGMMRPELVPEYRPASTARVQGFPAETSNRDYVAKALGTRNIPISPENVSLAGNKRDGALWRLADKLRSQGALGGIDTSKVEGMNALGNLRVPESLADDLVRIIKGDDIKTSAGNLLQITDQLQTMFKIGVLDMPARPTRDFFSGQIHSMLTGNWSWDSFKKAWALMRGETVDFTHHPVVQRMLKEQGLEATAENSTEIMRQLAYTRQLYGSGSHGPAEMLNQAGYARAEAVGATGPTTKGAAHTAGDYLPTRTEDFKAQFVGRDPHDLLRPSTLTAGSTWNPFKVRGVGGELDTKNYWAATFERFNTFTDGMNRLVPFIHNFERGTGAKRASQIVDAIQVLYAPHSFTDFERATLKRIFPFYSFSSRMTKHVVEELAAHPGGGVAQAIRGQHEMTENDLPLPAYVGETGAIPVKTLDDGTNRYITQLGLMHEDPLSFLGAGVGGVGLEALSRMNPLAKLPIELSTGQLLFQRGLTGGREIGEADPTLGRLLTNLGLQKEGVGGRANPAFNMPFGASFEHLLANSPLSRVLSTARTLTDPRKQSGIPGVPGLAALLPVTTGLRITDVSPAAQDVAISQRADRLAKDTLGGRTFTTTYIPKELIDQARQVNPAMAEQMDAFNKLNGILEKRQRARRKLEDAKKQMTAAVAP